MTNSIDIAKRIVKQNRENIGCYPIDHDTATQLAKDFLEAVEHLSMAAIAMHSPEIEAFLDRINGGNE